MVIVLTCLYYTFNHIQSINMLILSCVIKFKYHIPPNYYIGCLSNL